MLRLRKICIEIGVVCLNGMSQTWISATLLKNLSRFNGMNCWIVPLLPIQIMQQTNLTPEFNILWIILARIVTHQCFNGLAMMNMEFILVVLLKQLERLLAAQTRLQTFGSSLVRMYNRLSFRLHVWEEKHITNGRFITEQHDHTVNAVTNTASRRQAILKRADIVCVIIHSFLVASLFGLNLCAETSFLIYRVVELGKGISILMTSDNQLKTLGQARIGRNTLCQRRNLNRIIANKRWVYDLRFAQLIIKREDKTSNTPLGLIMHIIGIAELAEMLQRGVHINMLVKVL